MHLDRLMELHVTDMHTAGEPVRIVSGGYPELKGGTILDKRREAREHYDHLRRAIILSLGDMPACMASSR